MEENKIENKKRTNKLLPTAIICSVILIAGFIIFIFVKNNVYLTSDKAKTILKEKNEIYKKIIKPEPYCGDNANRTSDEINSDEKIVLYWNVSTQFKSYEQLLNFISENITENQIQKLKSNKSYTTFNENLYLEKDNKLYCGVVGAGSIKPNNTTYEIIEYTDNKIIGTATDIYGAEDVDIGLVNNGQYKYNITLIKENGLWKIDAYETGEKDNNNSNDIKTYKTGDLYFANNFNDYLNNTIKTTRAKYNDAKDIDGEIVIEEKNIYLKYDKDGTLQTKKININNEKPKYVTVLYANVIRYVYILTESGNVYLNQTQSLYDDLDKFLDFSKVNNLSNVSEMLLYQGTPYFLIDKKLYNKYGEFVYHDTKIKEDYADIQTSIGNYYYMQVDNDGLLYKKIIKKSYMIGSPESTSSILAHQKQQNELLKDTNNENIVVSVLLGVDNDTYLVDTKGNYYRIEIIDNSEIKLNKINSKKVSNVNKYSENSLVQKIEINYSDETKDTYLKDTNMFIW